MSIFLLPTESHSAKTVQYPLNTSCPYTPSYVSGGESLALEEAVRLGWELSNLAHKVWGRLERGGGMGDLLKSMLDATQ
ncbi:hypothetical protein P691DRAFT_763627 [Macrolepiota fuliginosa MF-IS2]|uniref:Uncharacterized protein n=1 Tax=Macrolepiota fuliginosa MF-IS2 TaxID=1400762 RepID=A0A9P6BYF2_9AGAR|nr:hypothetical protein P691DRAFT_763627 [Macrolepiota fuliginosa MF-IS2]